MSLPNRFIHALLVVTLSLTALAPAGFAQESEEPDRYGDDGLEEFRRAQRSATRAVVMSFPVPGWGQMYADSPFWSVVGFAAQFWFLGNILLERRRLERSKVQLDQARDLRDQQIEDTGSASGEILNTVETRELFVDEHRERARDFVWWAAGGYFVLALDAYVSVELASFDDPDPPTPDLDRDWDAEESDGEGVSLSLHFSF